MHQVVVEQLPPTSVELSILMLRAVLDGATYQEVAKNHGVTRTAVERRIKDVTRHVNQMIGIPGLTEDGIAFVRRLRANRLAILSALESLAPEELKFPKREKSVRVYSTEEILAAVGRVRAYSSQPLRDVTLFLLLFATGARPLEVARLQVRDYLQADGKVRRNSEWRPDVAINGIARPLVFASTRLDEALLPYLQERLSDGSVGADAPYCGLDPQQPLFLAAEGQGFTISAYTQGGQRRYLCRPILETYRKIFRYAGLHGGTPLAVRSTVAARLYARGAEDEQVGLVLGIAQRSSVRQMFPRIRPTIVELLKDLI